MSELSLIKNITEMSIIALKSFIKGNLINFDALVGENLCQIRAYKNIHLANFWLNNSENKKKLMRAVNTLTVYKIKIDAVANKWEKLVNGLKTYDKSLDGHETIEEFINRTNLYIELSEDIIYLISCYFLTHFSIKDSYIPVAINYQELSSKFTVSRHRAERLIHRYQLLVAKFGCDFIMKIASELPFSEWYLHLLPSLCQLSDVDRYVLPCHIVSEIILEHCIKKNIPILFLFNRVNLTQRETVYPYLLERYIF